MDRRIHVFREPCRGEQRLQSRMGRYPTFAVVLGHSCGTLWINGASMSCVATALTNVYVGPVGLHPRSYPPAHAILQRQKAHPPGRVCSWCKGVDQGGQRVGPVDKQQGAPLRLDQLWPRTKFIWQVNLISSTATAIVVALLA